MLLPPTAVVAGFGIASAFVALKRSSAIAIYTVENYVEAVCAVAAVS
jgi:hypothetical protein